MRWTIFSLLLAGCAHPHAEPDFIGTATMQPDRSVHMKLLSYECDGTAVHSDFTVQPTDANYAEIVHHVGELAPGRTRRVPAWPSAPCKK